MADGNSPVAGEGFAEQMFHGGTLGEHPPRASARGVVRQFYGVNPDAVFVE